MKVIKQYFGIIVYSNLLLTMFFVVSCEKSVLVSDIERNLGFIIITGGTTDNMSVTVVATATPEILPTVMINDSTLFSGWDVLTYDKFPTWSIDNILSGTTVDYTIIYDGVPLSGFFKIPDSISQVTCNSEQRIETSTNNKITAFNSSGASYLFTWTAPDADAFRMTYDFWYGTDPPINMGSDEYTELTSITLIPANSNLFKIDFKVAISGSDPIKKTGRTPDVVSSNAYIYHDIKGPWFSVSIYGYAE